MKQITFNESKPLRLDYFIMKEFSGLSGSLLHKFMRENKIKVNGVKKPLNYRLCKNDEVFLYFKDDYFTNTPKLSVAYEDDFLLVADKPAGLVSIDHPLDSLEIRAKNYLAASKKPCEPILCHRLDTGTSGLIIIAKDVETAEFIKGLMKSNKLQKLYWCVTFGIPEKSSARLCAFLKKLEDNKGVVISQTQKDAEFRSITTDYKTIATCGRLALLEINLITGRTHQIRAHLASIGTPILGDSKYGNNSANRTYRFKYQALCAHKLKFSEIDNDIYKHLSKMTITTKQPWFAAQIIDKELS